MSRGCLPLFLFIFLLFLLPFFLADVLFTALNKLGLSVSQSIFIISGIFLGGLINIPLTRLKTGQEWESYQNLFGIKNWQFPLNIKQNYTLLAINVGGGMIPAFLAFYQLYRFGILMPDYSVLTAMLTSVAINAAACYKLAKPVRNVGIALNPLIPAIIATMMAITMTPHHAPATAFVSGVLGPLIGADLLNLDRIKHISTGMASIGGAGTFDGIVLSGIIATLLA